MRKTKSRRTRTPGSVIPVTSFADIAFLLIIFFIQATTLQKPVGFVADLPAGREAPAEAQKAPTVNLLPDRVTFNDRDVSIQQLRGELGELELYAKQGDDRIVLLEAVGKVEYQRYFQVMAAIHKAGGVAGIIRQGGGTKRR